MPTLNIALDEFIEAANASGDPYEAYTAQPTNSLDEVKFDLNKEVLGVFKSIQFRFDIKPRVSLQADYNWTEEAEGELLSTDTLDGLDVALKKDPSALSGYAALMSANIQGVAHGECPDMFCHFYLSNTDGNMRCYMNVKSQNAGAVMIFLLEKIKARGLKVAEVIGVFKFPYVRSMAHKRRDVLVIWTDEKYLDDLLAAIKDVQKPMKDAFLEGPPLTTGTVDGIPGVGFAPHLPGRGYSYGTFLEKKFDTCGQNKNKWKSTIEELYATAKMQSKLNFT